MQTDDILSWVCRYCGEENDLWIDLTILDAQDLIEECRICCRPNRIIISHDRDNDEYIYMDVRFTDE